MPKPLEAEARLLGQTIRSRSTPQTHLSIVSPCSTCHNQRSAPEAGTGTQPGKPACPRRVWIKEKADREANGLTSEFSLDHLVLTGNEDSEGSSESLRNPVYFDGKGQSIIVWVAHLKDNPGVNDSEGNQITPQILDAEFDTDYINCSKVPFVPKDSEAQYFQKGAIKEGDMVESTTARDHQKHLSPSPGGGTRFVMIDGFVTKVNFLSHFPRVPVGKDEAPSGT